MLPVKQLLAASGLLALAACGASDPNAARLTVTVVGSPWTGGLAAALEAEATRPTLIAHDGTGALVPGLASSWRFVDDEHSLILRLRPVKWSDKSALGSNEVVAAFRRAAARGEPALAHAGVTTGTKFGVLAPISRVVEIRLKAASPLMLGWLADPGLAVTRVGPVPTLANYRAAGPATRRTLTRRDGMTSNAARPAAIVIAADTDAARAVAGFSRGESDVVIGDGLAGLGEARTAARPQMLQVDALWGVYGYVANGLKGPLADPKLRLALSLATDREALATRMGMAAMAPVEGLLPPSLTGRTAAVSLLGAPTEPPPLDMAAQRMLAQQLLAGADGKRVPIRLTLLLPPGRDHRMIAEHVAADWLALGVTLVISEVSPATMADKVRRGEFDLALTEASLPVPDAAALLSRWRCGAGPSCNAAADALFDRASAAPPDARPALLAAAAAKWMEGPPMVPLLTPLRWALVARRVDGWTPNRAGSHPLGRLSVTARR